MLRDSRDRFMKNAQPTVIIDRRQKTKQDIKNAESFLCTDKMEEQE